MEEKRGEEKERGEDEAGMAKKRLKSGEDDARNETVINYKRRNEALNCHYAVERPEQRPEPFKIAPSELNELIIITRAKVEDNT